MEKESEKVPDEVDRLATHRDHKRTLCSRRDGDQGQHGQNSDGREQDDGVEVHLPESGETVEEVKTDSCADKENVLKPGTWHEGMGQNSSLEDLLSPVSDEVQRVENIDEISEQEETEVPISEDFQIDVNSNEYYTENTFNTTKRLFLKITENWDDLNDIVRKYDIHFSGKTFPFHDFTSKMQHKKEYLYTSIKHFFKLDIFEDFAKCRNIYNTVYPSVNNFNGTYCVYPIFSESSSESESESENEEMVGNEVLLNQENGAVGQQRNASMQGNEEPRQGYGANHAENNHYQFENGSIVWHPTDESPSVSQPTATGVQISNNHMVVCSNTRSREESNLGHTFVTTESDTTVSSLVITSRTSLSNDLLDGNTAAAWHRDNFEGIPILRENPVGNGFQHTCTLDPGLMILLYQMWTNPRLLFIFSSSSHRIFKETLPALLNLFCNMRFEELRQTWADLIQLRGNSFYGNDGHIMMPPFSGILQCRYRLTCTNSACPANDREFTMADIIWSCPPEAFLDIAVLQDLIDSFEHGEMRLCNELNYHTRPDYTVEINPVVNTCFPTGTNRYSQCTGTQRTNRMIDTSGELPPVMVFNLGRSLLRRDQIGNLNGTVEIGGTRYYVGGLTFSGIEHFTARIYLPHRSIQLFYDNLQGIQVEQCPERDSDYLSLLFLIRKE